MDISVVVCTRNRCTFLPEMLNAIAQINTDNISCEMIFVDNGSSDNTLSVLEKFCGDFRIPSHVIFEPTMGLSSARNTGWRAARGDVICFTDDDCYPSSDWLQKIYQNFQRSSIGYLGGRVLLFDSEDAPVTIQTSEVGFIYKRNTHIESGCIIGANLSCRKEMLETVLGFDTRLGAGSKLFSGEDTDLLTRASLSGFEGQYDPDVVIYHHHRRRVPIEIQKLQLGYAYGRGALSMKMILESDAKLLYFKNWYWRIISLIKKRKYKDCINEFRGAFRFILC